MCDDNFSMFFVMAQNYLLRLFTFILQDDQSPLSSSDDIEYVVESGSLGSQKVIDLMQSPSRRVGWRPIDHQLKDLPGIYSSLAKSRLTGKSVAAYGPPAERSARHLLKPC